MMMPGCESECSILDGHIHRVMVIPPKYSISDIVGQIKGTTASQLRKKFSWLSKVYWKENIVWSAGYFVPTVGVDGKTVTQYNDYIAL